MPPGNAIAGRQTRGSDAAPRLSSPGQFPPFGVFEDAPGEPPAAPPGELLVEPVPSPWVDFMRFGFFIVVLPLVPDADMLEPVAMLPDDIPDPDDEPAVDPEGVPTVEPGVRPGDVPAGAPVDVLFWAMAKPLAPRVMARMAIDRWIMESP